MICSRMRMKRLGSGRRKGCTVADRWEYSVTDYMSVSEMNKLGAQGWEVAGAFNDVFTKFAKIIWKRRR
jgi:hypothetical protein